MPRYQLDRSIVIGASPERVYEIIADFGSWTTWSPWLIVEPTTRVTVSKDPAALGSTYAWQGEITGHGELEHKKLIVGELVDDELRFLKPFKATCQTAFKLTGERSGTRVTWTMDGAMPWFLFWMIPMFKTLIGMDYTRGLTMLKDLIESGTIPSVTKVHGQEQVGPLRMAGIADSCAVDNVGTAMDRSFEQAREEFRKLGASTDLGMVSVYTKFRMNAGVFEYISGYLIPADVTIPASSPLKTWSLPICKAFRVEHIGPYRHLGNGWSVANQLCRFKKLKQQRTGTFEIYRTPSPKTPESEIKTDIYLPLRG
ncbi:MAG: SRPBCC family protein [Pirellulaceae bacterium]|nr:SRPBCC family protein [Pirellulaceae bacterium]